MGYKKLGVLGQFSELHGEKAHEKFNYEFKNNFVWLKALIQRFHVISQAWFTVWYFSRCGRKMYFNFSFSGRMRRVIYILDDTVVTRTKYFRLSALHDVKVLRLCHTNRRQVYLTCNGGIWSWDWKCFLLRLASTATIRKQVQVPEVVYFSKALLC